MAYCRFGEGSDVYAYKSSDDHFSIHVAAKEGSVGFVSFTENSLQAFKTRLEELKSDGYMIPDHTFERIERELNVTKGRMEDS
jgi:hypothetical protein